MDSNVLLFSGGIDSFVAYFYLWKQFGTPPATVYFDLGAPYNRREIEVVKRLIPSTIIDTSVQVGDTQRGQNAFIPYRNLLLACIARKYGNSIWIAGLKDDCVEDKNPQAFNCMNDCMNFISKPEDGCKLQSPFWNMTKVEVVQWWMKHAADFGMKTELILQTISCYDQFEATNYCGRCPSCFRKFIALWTNGFKIDFYNQKMLDDYIERAERRVYDQERCDNILMAKDYKCKKVYCLDIDGVLTVDTEGHDYLSRSPHKLNIEAANILHQLGNKIVLFTSRLGIGTDKQDTAQWLRMHGVEYDALLFGKPYADFYVDDKNIQLEVQQ